MTHSFVLVLETTVVTRSLEHESSTPSRCSFITVSGVADCIHLKSTVRVLLRCYRYEKVHNDSVRHFRPHPVLYSLEESKIRTADVGQLFEGVRTYLNWENKSVMDMEKS